jgi:predicted ester cyclase
MRSFTVRSSGPRRLGSSGVRENLISAAIRSVARLTARTQTLMEQANADSAKKYVVEFLIHGDVSVAYQLADPDLCVYTGLSRSGAIRGLEVYSELIHGFCTALPVKLFTIEDSYCGEEFAVVRIKGVRNFRYDLWGVTATGQNFDFLDVHFLRFNSGKIFEEVASTQNQEMEKLFAPAVLPILRAKARGFSCNKDL